MRRKGFGSLKNNNYFPDANTSTKEKLFSDMGYRNKG